MKRNRLRILILFFFFLSCQKMPTDFVNSQIERYKEESKSGKDFLEEITNESPFERARKEIREALQRTESYAASILKGMDNFGSFANLVIDLLSNFFFISWIVARNHINRSEKYG
jgi:hypothetical protein